jgi:succinate dehydrogenase flavin-adding protein (antitoxin of CptAB toxin-antitoxin module)
MGTFAAAQPRRQSERCASSTRSSGMLDLPGRRPFLKWLTGEAQVPENYDSDVFRRLKAFHQHDKPIHV